MIQELKNLPWSMTDQYDHIKDAKGRTVADCRYTSGQGRAIVQCANSHAQLERTNAALLGALKGLRNEIHGLLHWREPQLRELGGNTNVEVLKHKIALADAAIAEAESLETQKENGK